MVKWVQDQPACSDLPHSLLRGIKCSPSVVRKRNNFVAVKGQGIKQAGYSISSSRLSEGRPTVCSQEKHEVGKGWILRLKCRRPR